jgi:Uri superfamily endonuclease
MNNIATPTATTDPQQGPQTYQLLIEVAAPVCVCVGRFGTFDFPAGRYSYTGSAKRNFEARVRRHHSTTKTLRWHIDYLLAAPGVQIVEVLCRTLPECQVNQATVGEVLVSGFGASDCHSGCGSHLKKLG